MEEHCGGEEHFGTTILFKILEFEGYGDSL
jgi:hypothetical protein